ncbi:MAG TPA: hypothetical protein VGH89_43520 [Pseudonocardia sp.]
MSDKIRVLQALRLKGRPQLADVVSATGLDEAALAPVLAELAAAELSTEANGRYRLTKPGRDELTRLIADERTGVDQAALTELYHEFDAHNSAFKQLVTDWQLKDGVNPNDHTDVEYDNKIVQRLGELHTDFRPLVERMVAVAPRLTPYPGRFDAALAKVRAGESTWFARPLIDSYHTVWFELHEDLIGLAGLSRAEEAAAGRAE